MMKYLKRYKIFENIFDDSSENDENKEQIKNENEENILKYLSENYPESWWNENFSDMVYDYVDEDMAEEHEGDYEEAYKAYAMGGAIEYDLLDSIFRELESSDDFNFEIEKDALRDLIIKHMKDTIEWFDRLVF